MTEQKRDSCNFSGKALGARDELLRYLAIYFTEIFMSNQMKSELLTTCVSNRMVVDDSTTSLKPHNRSLLFLRSTFLTKDYRKASWQRTNR